jgi:3-methyl-2-oxobutanoate hydroxymethyltransferase
MKTVLDFQKMKAQGKRISMVTCYDYTSAKIVSASNVDCILVGDSLAMTMHGYTSTLPATPELMALHVEAVRRGCPDKFIVGDMPFLAHNGSIDRTMEAARIIMKSGAQALKIEGIDGAEATIKAIVDAGVPVMGHLGLTPQSVHKFGGFKVQGTQERAAEMLLDQALRLERCGAFSIVLEAIPTTVAKHVTENLSIPTIGIGAGNVCSGQVLVMQDLLGLNVDFQPRFVRRYLEGFQLMKEAFDNFDRDVKSAEFPSEKESYAIETKAEIKGLYGQA